MENLISRPEFMHACDLVDSVAGTAAIKRCTEDNAGRYFPTESYLDYLAWLDELNISGTPESPYNDLPPLSRFERGVMEAMGKLEGDGSLYLEDYRMFVSDEKQILFALNRYFGMAWIHDHHVNEAIRRKRQRRKNIRD